MQNKQFNHPGCITTFGMVERGRLSDGSPVLFMSGGVEGHAIEHCSEIPEKTEMVNRLKDGESQAFPQIGGTHALTPRVHMRNSASLCETLLRIVGVAPGPLTNFYALACRHAPAWRRSGGSGEGHCCHLDAQRTNRPNTRGCGSKREYQRERDGLSVRGKSVIPNQDAVCRWAGSACNTSTVPPVKTGYGTAGDNAQVPQPIYFMPALKCGSAADRNQPRSIAGRV